VIYTPDTWPDTWPSFSFNEMRCRVTSECDMEPEFMDRLQALRDAVGPLRVSSGYRSPSHPIEARKPQPGAHAQGIATDVAVAHGGRAYEILKAALHLDFKGIGISLLSDPKYIHLDLGGVFKPFHATRPAVWVYK